MSLSNLIKKAKEQKQRGNYKPVARGTNIPRTNQENYVFDFNINFRDLEKFTLCKRLLSAEVGSKFGECATIIEHGRHHEYTQPEIPFLDEADYNTPEEYLQDLQRENMHYGAHYNAYVKAKSNYDTKCVQAYHFIWSKCSTAMKNAVKQDPDFTTWDRENDVLALWLRIVDISMNGTNENENEFKRQNEARHRFDRLHQKQNEPTGDFYDRFNEYYDAMVGQRVYLYQVVIPPNLPEQQRQQLIHQTQTREEAMKAMAFLNKLDRSRFGSLLDELENAFQFGRDEYPTDLTSAYSLACRYREKGTKVDGNLGREKFNAAFVAPAENKKGINKKNENGKGKHDPKCWHCEQQGHTRPQCPLLVKSLEYFAKKNKTFDQLIKDVKDGVGLVSIQGLEEFIFTEKASRPFDDNDILLDNQASVSVFCNENLLTNIRPADFPIRITGVGKSFIKATLIGEFMMFGTVYFNKEAISNNCACMICIKSMV
jgi:hypothetical protein